jgi:hypothetical protein
MSIGSDSSDDGMLPRAHDLPQLANAHSIPPSRWLCKPSRRLEGIDLTEPDPKFAKQKELERQASLLPYPVWIKWSADPDDPDTNVCNYIPVGLVKRNVGTQGGSKRFVKTSSAIRNGYVEEESQFSAASLSQPSSCAECARLRGIFSMCSHLMTDSQMDELGVLVAAAGS